MENIVKTWITSQRENHGCNQTQALERLNSALSSQHTPHRLSEWKQARRRLPLNVANYMLDDAVSYVHKHNKPIGLLRLPVPSN